MSRNKIASLLELKELDKIDESVEANQSLGYKIIMEFVKLLNIDIIIESDGDNLGSCIKLIINKQ